MADFYTMIYDLTTSIFEKAAMEMSSGAPGTATFTVYTSGGSSTSASATFNADCFLTSEDSTIVNLFAPSGRTTAMVKASSSVGKSAILRQWSGAHDVGCYVPPATKTLGNDFRIPASTNMTPVHLLIGNPTGSSVTINLYYGTSGTPSVTQSIPALNFAVLEVTGENKAVRVTSTGSVFVQAAVIMNSECDVSFVLPD